MIYVQIFGVFFKIGLFNFGGGYPMISFIQNEVVQRRGWISMTEFTDIVAVSQMTPGPVGINMATYTGYMASGNAWGALCATLAVCLPSFIIMLLLATYFLKYQHHPRVQAVFSGLRPAVVGLIVAAALMLCNAENFIDIKSIMIFAVCLVALCRFKVRPVPLILLCGAAGWLLY